MFRLATLSADLWLSIERKNYTFQSKKLSENRFSKSLIADYMLQKSHIINWEGASMEDNQVTHKNLRSQMDKKEISYFYEQR